MPLNISEHITIKDAADNTVAFLSPESDKLKDCWISRRLDEEETLTFYLPADSPKLAEFYTEGRIIAGNREFTMLKPDVVDIIRDEKGIKWAKIMATGSWSLLSKIQPTINNDPNYPWPKWRKGNGGYDDIASELNRKLNILITTFCNAIDDKQITQGEAVALQMLLVDMAGKPTELFNALGSAGIYLGNTEDEFMDAYIVVSIDIIYPWYHETPHYPITISEAQKNSFLDEIENLRECKVAMFNKIEELGWENGAVNDPSYGWIVPDALTVCIVSGGNDLSGGLYPVGSAGHALYALLENSDEWTLGAVDVEGTRDLETDKENLLSNIKEVQKVWGGHLVWEYVLDKNGNITERIVHLRDEDKWKDYNGFQVRYAKNLKHITRTVNNNIVTKLYPFGENDLDISSVNNGVKYVENYSYTNKVYQDVWNNPDIFEPDELKEEAERYLVKICKPRYTYRAKIADLRVLPEYQHEHFELGDMVDVIDDDLLVNDLVRIVQHRYNVFMPWQCELEVGEPEERLSSRLVREFDATGRIVSSKFVQNLLKGTVADDVDIKSLDILKDNFLDFFSDGKLTLIEANTLKVSFQQVWEESRDLVSTALNLLIDDEAYNYGYALGDLMLELNNWIGDYKYPLLISIAQRNYIIALFEEVQNTKTILINKITDVKDAMVEQNAEGYTDGELLAFAGEVVGMVGDLEGLIDGKVDVWFYPYVPTSAKEPESMWGTTVIKDKHLGDLFFNTLTDYAYRYAKSGTNYYWDQIQDQDVTQALTVASNAKDTADGKRRVFVVTPYPPYDVGDLWAGSNDDLKKCVTKKTASQSYSANDWEVVDTFYTKSSTVVVAASNSQNKRHADYVCSGSSDQATINSAINSLPSGGGKVVLLEGAFIVNDSIVVPSNITIEGQGYGTELRHYGGASGFSIIKNSNTSAGNKNIKIWNLRINGQNKSISGIYFTKVSYSECISLYVGGCFSDYGGIGLITGNQNNIISNNVLEACDVCILLALSGNEGNKIQDNIAFSSNSRVGIGVIGGNNVVSGNTCNNMEWGIVVFPESASTAPNSVTGNACSNNDDYGIYIHCDNGTINGNVLSRNTIHCTGDYNNIQNNTVRRNGKSLSYGMAVIGDHNVVTNNDLYDSSATPGDELYIAGSGNEVDAGNRY